MNIELTTTDRLVLLSILPKQGTLVTMRTVREALESLSFSAEEQAALKFEALPNGSTKWDTAAEKLKSVEISATIMAMIIRSFEGLVDQQKLELVHLPVYEKFLGM